jgi:hypothetical protein
MWKRLAMPQQADLRAEQGGYFLGTIRSQLRAAGTLGLHATDACGILRP